MVDGFKILARLEGREGKVIEARCPKGHFVVTSLPTPFCVRCEWATLAGEE